MEHQRRDQLVQLELELVLEWLEQKLLFCFADDVYQHWPPGDYNPRMKLFCNRLEKTAKPKFLLPLDEGVM